MKKFYSAAAGIMLVLCAQQTAAATTIWDTPVFTQKQRNVPANQVPLAAFGTCINDTKFVIIPEDKQLNRAEVSQSNCAVSTPYGLHDFNGNLTRTDVSYAGKSNVIPIAHSPHVLQTASGATYGTRLSIIKNYAQNIYPELFGNGSMTYRLKSGVTAHPIVNSAGTPIEFQGYRFSENGKWMIADVHQKGLTRVNIETGETLTFGDPYNHAVGVRPNFITAISGDGRYVVSFAAGYNHFNIYDLSNCIPHSDPTKRSLCTTQSILTEATGIMGGFKQVVFASFSTATTIRLYIQHTDNSYTLYTVSPRGATESSLDYLALGDSYASGEGTFNYVAGTDVRDPHNKCHNSPLSYPYLIAGAANVNGVKSVACSGARLKDINSSTYTEQNAQAKGKNSELFTNSIMRDYLPGYRPQEQFVARAKPLRISVSIGGNDIGFAQIIQSCLAPGTCYNSAQERLDLAYTINSRYDDLVASYVSVKNSAATNGSIYIIGYPSIAKPDGNCAVNVQLNSQELEFSNTLIHYLNSVVKSAAQKAGVTYIDTSEAFYGYRLCENKSDHVAVNGITAGDDKTFSVPLGDSHTLDGYFTGQESYHPNKKGHELYARTILGATNNMSMPSPEPTTAPRPTTASASAVSFIGTHSSGDVPHKILFKTVTSESVLLTNTSYTVAVSALAPNKPATIRVGSYTKTVTVNAEGVLQTSITLPAFTAHGIETIHVTAKNTFNEAVDVQQTVFIGKQSADFDGDGTLNHQESCLFVTPSNTDIDSDGVDDGCDAHIGAKPLSIAVTAPTNSKTIQLAATSHEPTNTVATNANHTSTAEQPTIVTASVIGESQKISTPSSSAPHPKPSTGTTISRYNNEFQFAVLAVIAAFSVATIVCLSIYRWRKQS